MDFVTPALFGVLAVLAVLVYVRLGHLVTLIKETRDTKSKQISTPESSTRLKMLIITAKSGTDAKTIIVKHDVASKTLHSGLISKSINRVVLNGGTFEVDIKENSDPNLYTFELKPCSDKSPFSDQNKGDFTTDFKQYYCICF
jgi:hypothetical protein